MLETKLFSKNTLHVKVPQEIPTALFDDWMSGLCDIKAYYGVEEEDGGLLVEPREITSILKDDDMPQLLRTFLEEVQVEYIIHSNVDDVYFHR